MAEETPQFTAKPLTEEEPKKPSRRRVSAPPRTRKKAAKVAPPKITFATERETKEINECLTSIYRDDNGTLPNMKEIKVQKTHPVLRAFTYILVMGSLLALVAWAGLFFFPQSGRFSADRVSLAVDGPSALTLGATTTYTITYTNNQDIPLHDVTLQVTYPAGFLFLSSSIPPSNAGHNEWNIGTIAAQKRGVVSITGQSYGTLKEDQSWRVFLNYQPENFKSELQKVATLNTAIASSPLRVTIAGPDKSYVGAEAEYTFSVVNESTWIPSRLELAPAIPSNFVVTTSTPPLDKNNRWIIKPPTASTSTTSTLPLAKTTFKIKGKWGTGGENSGLIKAALFLPAVGTDKTFQVAQSELTTEIAKTNLDLNVAINGSLTDVDSKPGDLLNITLRLKNTSNKSMKNVALELAFEAPSVKKQSILNWPEVVDEHNGTIQGDQLSDTIRRGRILWNNKNIPALNELKPNTEVLLDVRLPIRDATNFDLSDLPSHKIQVLSSAIFSDEKGITQTAHSNQLAITLNSNLAFETRDLVSTSEGKEAHAITWVLTNSFHSLKNIKLVATLFGDVTWKQNGAVSAGGITDRKR